MPPKAPIAGARLDEQVGDGFGRFAIKNEIDFAVPVGPPLNRAAFPDQLYSGKLDGLTALAQRLSRHPKGPAERGRRSDHGVCGKAPGNEAARRGRSGSMTNAPAPERRSAAAVSSDARTTAIGGQTFSRSA